MKKILLACMGGMSSGLMTRKLLKYMLKLGMDVKMIEIDSKANMNNFLKDKSDFTLSYCSVYSINRENREMYGEIFDVILIAPQCAYLMDGIKIEAEKQGHNPKRIVRIPNLAYSGIGSSIILTLIEDTLKNLT